MDCMGMMEGGDWGEKIGLVHLSLEGIGKKRATSTGKGLPLLVGSTREVSLTASS